MHITDRTKKSKSESCVTKPEEKYIAFATNRPDIDLKRYSERWMIETGFRMIENERVRTRSRNVSPDAVFSVFSCLIQLLGSCKRRADKQSIRIWRCIL